jgi:uncharacterized protein YaaN involved in tellurite resistance
LGNFSDAALCYTYAAEQAIPRYPPTWQGYGFAAFDAFANGSIQMFGGPGISTLADDLNATNASVFENLGDNAYYMRTEEGRTAVVKQLTTLILSVEKDMQNDMDKYNKIFTQINKSIKDMDKCITILKASGDKRLESYVRNNEYTKSLLKYIKSYSDGLIKNYQNRIKDAEEIININTN